ncbi:MAG TPA: AAA family ATPase, partial [Bacillota bacterium]
MSVSTPDLAAGEERLLQCLDEINRRVTASRWLPRRLILINWWLFGEQVFHFAQGRLVLHGRNASGKSTVLSAAVTLVLDGNKSPERIDTFGGRGRNVRYYLIGDADATPDSSFYFEGRTGYVALEFQHGASGRTLTIGVGLYTHRSRPGGEVDFWGFSIEDGRRIGEDLFLYDDQRLPLSWRALEERIGRGGRVVRSVAEYKRLVNALLFGFDDPADYDDLLTLLLELRSPKLNKDLRPSDVCEVLRTALAPLEEGLLDQVSVTIEAIDECLDRIAETDEQVRAVQAIDDAAAAYLNQEAQLVAVSLRAAMAARARAQALYTRLEQGLSRERTRLDAYSHLLARVQQVLGEVDAELRALEAHQAFRAESDLEAARQELDEAQRRLNETRAELEKAVQAVDRFAQRADAARRDWQRQRAALSEHLAETAGHARAAAWAAAQEVIAGLARAVEALGLPDARLGEA